jgi:hypothetical protein
MHELGFVGSRHHHHPRKTGEKGHVERTGMGRAVGADKPCPVYGEADRQPLDGDVVHDLVVSALEERRVDGGEGLIAFGCQPSGERNGMLLGDTDVEASLREDFGEAVEPGSRWHRRGDGDNLRVGARLLDQSVREHLGVARGRACGGGLLRTGNHVEAADAVELVG